MGSLKGKVGIVNNRDLRIPKSGVHYVLIRERRGKNAKVSVITSLGTVDVTNKKVNIPSEKEKRLYDVARGKFVPIPMKYTNLPQWSAVRRNKQNVPVSKIYNIGKTKINRKLMFDVNK